MSKEERINILQAVKCCLIKTYKVIEGVADTCETNLPTEYDRAMSKEYGSVCQILGFIEERLAIIEKQIKTIK